MSEKMGGIVVKLDEPSMIGPPKYPKINKNFKNCASYIYEEPLID